MIPISEFNAALSCALAAAGTDPKRPELMAVLLEFLPEDLLRFVATDGHRLTYVECQVAHGQPDGSSFVLYSEYARKLVKSFPAKSKGRLTLAPYGEEILFTDGETVETFGRTAQEFPDYRRVLSHADEPPRSACMPIDQVLEALDAFKPFAARGLTVELHDRGPSYFTPRIKQDMESIRAALTVIMSFKP